MLLKKLGLGLTSLLFPGTCLGCALPLSEAALTPLCQRCLEQLPRSRPPWCRVCGRSFARLGAGAEICLTCRLHPPAFACAISPFLYEGLVRTLIQALKYQGRLCILGLLNRLLAEAIPPRLAATRLDGVVPVPLHPRRHRERTFNQSERLARGLARHLHLPLRTDLLRRASPTLPQAQLQRGERRANVRSAFASRPDRPIRGAHLLLVDDVFTTGATADACARTLRRAGAASVTVVTFAHG